jgi:hypothetical protein
MSRRVVADDAFHLVLTPAVESGIPVRPDVLLGERPFRSAQDAALRRQQC